MTMQLKLHSQSGKGIDTSLICINKQDALYHLSRSDSLTGYKKLVAEKQKDIDTLNARIIILGEQIKQYRSKDTIYSEIAKLKDEQMQEMKEQRLLFQDQLNGYEKLLKKERRKRFLTAAGGVITTGLVAYLYLTK